MNVNDMGPETDNATKTFATNFTIVFKAVVNPGLVLPLQVPSQASSMLGLKVAPRARDFSGDGVKGLSM